MKKYSENDLKFMYINKPNELSNIFKKAGYTDEYIINMFNSAKEEIIILRAQKILLALEKDEINNEIDKYNIPIKYNIPEASFLKKDREEIYKEMNNTIDKNIGETLEQIYSYNQEEYVTAIHRTSLSKEQIINNIFEQGISYEYDLKPDHCDHVQIIENFPFFLREIKYCNNYKFSQGVVILKIPKKYIGKEKTDELLPLYYKANDGKTYLRPEFVSAYVPVKNEKICDVIFNTKNHNIYNNDTIYHIDDRIKLK